MFRFEYDRVVGFHPYRTHQPWDHGGVRLFHIDGVNGYEDEAERVRAMIGSLERKLLKDAKEDGVDAHHDNHYGFTVMVEGERGRPDPGAEVEQVTPDMYYQLRFSDCSLCLWLMPGPPAALARNLANRSVVTDFTPIPPMDALEAQAFAEARDATGTPPDPLAQAPWNEPLPNLPTQAVDAHAEAAIDEAMARAYGQMEPDK